MPMAKANNKVCFGPLTDINLTIISSENVVTNDAIFHTLVPCLFTEFLLVFTCLKSNCTNAELFRIQGHGMDFLV